jgi:hypothetical protein
MCSKFVLAALFLFTAMSVYSQSGPAAIESVWRVNVGGGATVFHDDFYGPGEMEGPTAWVDLFPNRGPRLVHGLGIEVEGHEISFGGPQPQVLTSNASIVTRQDTYGGGPIYEWRHFKNFVPYGKFLWEQGSIDFNVGVPTYKHDNRSLYEYGAGFSYRLVHHIAIRGEFDKQVWQRLFQNHAVTTVTGIILEPRGATLGATYEFDKIHFRGRIKEQ